MHKKVAAGAVALALLVGVFGSFAAPQAHAESGSSHSTLSTMSEEKLIALLQDLIKLLEKRLEALVKERGSVSSDDSSDDDRCATSTDSGLSELEADIFTNETVIKIELDGKKEVFTTDADTRAEIIDAVEAKFKDLKEADIDDVLTVEREDRASRANDKKLGSFGSDDSSCDDGDDDDDNRGHGNDDDHDDDDNSGKGHGGHGDDDEDDD